MATRTRADLVLEVLDKLGVLAAGQTPAIEDTDRVNDKLPSLIAEFAGREIVYVPNLEQIPLPWFTSIAAMVAFECRDSFGVVGEDAAMLQQKNDESIVKLRIMLRGRPTYATLQGSYM